MIRFSVITDFNGIISLWQEAFGDSEAEIMFFLDKRYKPENTLIIEEDGKIASMLFLLEGEMSVKGKCYPSYYLYAACTLNEYRGRGYMASLLDFAKETALNRGYYFICLMPGEKSLYDFYEKHGYKAIFKKKLLTVYPDAIKKDSILQYEAIDNIEELRSKAFDNADIFKWNKEALQFAFDHHKFFGGKAFVNRKGYILYSKKDNILVVKEITFTDDFCSALFHILALEKNVDKLHVHLPVEYESTLGSCKIIDSGMMLAVNEDAEKIMNKISNAYLGLTLD